MNQIQINFFNRDGDNFKSIHTNNVYCETFDIPENAVNMRISFSPNLNSGSDCNTCSEELSLSESDELSSAVETLSFAVDEVDIIERDVPLLRAKPYYAEYYIEGARLQTFDSWPKTMKQTPKDMAAAGFFFTQKDDRVICFCCGGGLMEWKEDDDPWEQHAIYYGECDYLHQMKGDEYVATINGKININLRRGK